MVRDLGQERIDRRFGLNHTEKKQDGGGPLTAIYPQKFDAPHTYYENERQI
jgi:hypothetical protein